MKVAGPAFILWPIQGSGGKQSKGKVERKEGGMKRWGKDGGRKEERKKGGGRKEKAGKDKKREAGRKGGEKEGGREMERSG